MKIYLGIVVLLSLIAFVSYGIDKRAARRGTQRIGEKKFYFLAALGGWPGSLLGQQFFRHKTSKVRFRIFFWLATFLNVGIVTAFCWYAFSHVKPM